jgi:hypothetical protein
LAEVFLAGVGIAMPGMFIPPIDCAIASSGAANATPAASKALSRITRLHLWAER